MAFALAACEGSEPSFYQISGQRPAFDGQAMATMTCVRFNRENGRCSGYGTSIEIQFLKIHNAKPYIAQLRKGPCSPRVSSLVSAVPLRTIAFEPGEGVLADFPAVDVPIHWFLHAGYSAALYDTRARRTVACGALDG